MIKKQSSAQDKIKAAEFDKKIQTYFENIEDLTDLVEATLKLRGWGKDKTKDDYCLDLQTEFKKKSGELMDLVEKIVPDNELELSSKYRAKYLILKDLVGKMGRV